MSSVTETTAYVQITTLIVTVDQIQRWQRALLKAQIARLGIQCDHGHVTRDGLRVLRFWVESQSQPGTRHQTSIARDQDNVVTTTCTCPAGAVPVPCVHAALAIESAGWWQFIVLTQTEMPHVDPVEQERHEPAPVQLAPAQFRQGQAVKVQRSRNTFWIRAVVAEPFGWVYELEDIARNPAGKFGESSLTLATVKRSRAA
jgi:hypothetical protein